MKSVLLIDDDLDLSARLKQYFAQFDIQLNSADRPSVGLALLSQENYDLLLLDVMLPEKDGFTLCKEIRQRHDLPIIMLTARGELTDKVLGLEIGADDYLAKPFEPRELVARIEVLLRRYRSAPNQQECWRFAELCIYPQNHKVLLRDQEVNLTGMEFRCLCLLAQHPGQVFNRDELLNELRGIDADVYSRSIDILLSRLRQKLGDDVNAPKYIKTLRNVGYCFIGQRE